MNQRSAMIVTQTLASGIVVRQDFRNAVRPVFFQTGFEEFLYATHGGTLFVVRFRGKMYALMCGHVFKDFPHGRLFVRDEKFARKETMPAPVGGICYASSPRDAAEGTDMGNSSDDYGKAFERVVRRHTIDERSA